MIPSRDTRRDVPGYEGRYSISASGEVFSLRTGKRLSAHKDGDGYWRIGLWDGVRQTKHAVHRLVALAFHGDKRNALHCEVAHLNGDPSDPRASNLKWVSKVENRSHRKLHGTECDGERHGIARLTAEAVAEIRAYPRGKINLVEVATKFGVSRAAIVSVRSGKNWRSVRSTSGANSSKFPNIGETNDR